MAEAKLVDEFFQPIRIEITLVTQRELDLFGTIFNYAPFSELNLEDGDWCMPIRRAVEEVGGNIHRTGELDIAFEKWSNRE